MFKRTWIIVALVLAAGILTLSACGSGDLAEDLTPIPTLADQEEPELKDAIREGITAAAQTTEGDMGQDELVSMGEQLFSSACAGCHGAEDGAGPALTGMGARAATRVEGMSAEDYLHESIVEPNTHIVEGYSEGVMPPNYGDQYSEQELNALVAYILDAGGGEAETPAETPAEEATEEPEAVETEEPEESATEEPTTGDPENGETLFAAACSACHGAEPGVGPALTGMAERAAEQVEGMSAEEYLHESIVEPNAYIVEGYSEGVMPQIYTEQYSDAEIADLVAYMLEAGGGEVEEADEAPAEEESAEPEAEETAEPEAEETEESAAGDPANGEAIFTSACGACHGAEDGVGPALTGMGARAADRVEGMSAEEYLHEAIVEPSAHVVEGFNDGIMPQNYGDQYSDSELDDLIAYMLTQ